MITELKEYKVKKGRMAEWIRLMHETIIPFLEEKGLENLETYVVEDDPDLFIWIRPFKSLKERERVNDTIFDSPMWRDTIRPQMNALLNTKGSRTRLLHPPPHP